MVIPVIEVQTAEHLMERLSGMNRENSICQVSISGKGIFTIVWQEEFNPQAKLEIEGHAERTSDLLRNPYL